MRPTVEPHAATYFTPKPGLPDAGAGAAPEPELELPEGDESK